MIVVIVGSFGLASNVVGLFLFHGPSPSSHARISFVSTEAHVSAPLHTLFVLSPVSHRPRTLPWRRRTLPRSLSRQQEALSQRGLVRLRPSPSILLPPSSGLDLLPLRPPRHRPSLCRRYCRADGLRALTRAPRATGQPRSCVVEEQEPRTDRQHGRRRYQGQGKAGISRRE